MIASALPYLPVLMPLFVFGAALEAYWLHKRGKSYPWAECASTLGVWLGQRANNTLVGGSVFAILLWFESFQSNPIFFTSVWDWLVLFVLMEFCYYWQHRLSHECRWFWATHSVHHSPNRMVLLGALRLGWTGSVTGIFLFFVPMVLIGYSVLDVLLVLGINLLYQFWLHTELVPKLGVLEWVFNTPSHHRVHHASNPQYIDRNYGGMLIVFDRLFGTFAEENEDEPLRYGLVKPVTTHNPIRIALNEWMQIGKELRYARTLSHIIQILFSAPAADTSQPSTSSRSFAMKKSIALTLSICLLAGVAYGQNMRQPSAAQVEQFKLLLSDEMPKRFAAADKDKNGQLTKPEAQSGMPRVYKNFDAIDAQKKGYITEADIVLFAEQKIAQAQSKKQSRKTQ